MSRVLDRDLRNKLDRTVKEARNIAELEDWISRRKQDLGGDWRTSH